ncbi:MAG TPA: two-component regulator propeller domain-containing protein, partial [Chryseosolibacter sp.]|nr:two-component regulator propeller domain-containing protein [Chryseosolibacter sp.]
MRHLLTPLLVLCMCIAVRAQSTRQFDRLEEVKGLQNRSITSITQDNLGFIWFGSQDGLIRYDGYRTRVLKANLKDPNSISDNNVRALAKDSSGNLWIATQGGGLDHFNARSEAFTHFKHRPNDPASISGNAVWSVFVDSKGRVWAGTFSNGLNMIDPRNGRVTRVRESSSAPVLAIAEDDAGMIWFSSNGLNRVDPESLTVENFPAEPDHPASIRKGGIRSLLFDNSTGRIWVGVEDGGLFQFDRTTKRLMRASVIPANRGFNSIYALHVDTHGNVWAGGNEGAAVLSDSSVDFCKHAPSDNHSLSTNAVRAVYSDSFGTTWIGTEGGGVNRALNKKAFHVFRNSPSDASSLSYNVIRSIYEDRLGAIWVGTQGGGLNRFDPRTAKFETVAAGSREISA